MAHAKKQQTQQQSHSYYLFSFTVLAISGLVYCYLNNYFTELLLVHTRYGVVQGFASRSRDGREFYQFNAIPYAKPPLGKLRFQPPAPVEPWAFLDATRMTPVCSQFDMVLMSFRGQEDCLFLNIFTTNNPKRPHKKLLPVMVFIHGGLFMFGGSWELYGGRYFMDEEVVFVTLNYRLGLLGFLNTGDEVVSGNMGLKDQLEAFKFLKRIIGDFGGDPNRLTIFGESAGGSSVHYHMLSPRSQGAFQSGISQSGSAFCPWAFQRSPREQAIRLGSQVGCPTTSSSTELVDCLQSLDVWKLIEPHKSLLDIFMDPLDVYGPSVENVTSNEKMAEAFLTDYPYKLAAQGKTHPVSWIVGVNSHEGCFRSSWFHGQEKLLNRLNSEWPTVASSAFFLFRNDSETLDNLWKYHFSSLEDEKEENITPDDYQSLTNLIGDRLFTLPTRDAAVLHAKHHGSSENNVSTYLYYYSQKGDISLGDFLSAYESESSLPGVLQMLWKLVKTLLYNRMEIETFDYGVCHFDELFQFMSMNPTSILDITKGHPQYKFSKNLIKAWVKFATDGDPGHFNGVPWEKLSLSENKTNNNATTTAAAASSSPPTIPKYLHLNGNHTEMIKEPFHSRLPFWHRLKLPRNLHEKDEARYDPDVIK